MQEYYGKTVLVTGATGLIGSHIVDILMSTQKVKVIALGRSEAKLKNGFSEYLDNENFQVVAQDIMQELQLQEKIDYIFHAAGPMEGKIIQNYPMDVINPNITGTMNCLDYLKKQELELGVKGRLILFSSVTVYGNNTELDLSVNESETRVTENLESRSAPYSQSKRMSEVIALAYCRQFGVDVVIGRFSTVYGSTRFIPETAFFEFISKAINREDITLNCAGLPRRDNIYVDDAVNAVLLIGAKGNCGEAYNISSNGDMGNYVSVDEIAQVIARVSNELYIENSISVKFKEESNGERKPGLKLDNTKIKALGWDVTVSIEEGCKRTIMDIVRR